MQQQQTLFCSRARVLSLLLLQCGAPQARGPIGGSSRREWSRREQGRRVSFPENPVGDRFPQDEESSSSQRQTLLQFVRRKRRAGWADSSEGAKNFAAPDGRGSSQQNLLQLARARQKRGGGGQGDLLHGTEESSSVAALPAKLTKLNPKQQSKLQHVHISLPPSPLLPPPPLLLPPCPIKF